MKSANNLYEFTVKCCRILLDLAVMFSIENPENSLFWMIPFVVAFLQLTAVKQVTFQHCAYGGSRPKKTRFAFFPAGATT